jgi:hypothetical protein
VRVVHQSRARKPSKTGHCRLLPAALIMNGHRKRPVTYSGYVYNASYCKKDAKIPRCWTCKLRKVKCDETPGSCKACAKTGLTCGGYGIRLRWMSPNDEDFSSADQTTRIGRRKLDLGSSFTVAEWPCVTDPLIRSKCHASVQSRRS